MKKSFYMLLLIAGLVMAAMSSCNKYADYKARKQHMQDSIDSVDSLRVADSIYRVQTAGMLRADSVMQHRSDSLHYAWAHAAQLKRKAQAEARAFVSQVMRAYINALNTGGNPSTALGNNASNAVVRQLAQINGNPEAARESNGGGGNTFTLVGVANAKDDGWYSCTWNKGNQRITCMVKVNPNGRDHMRIDEMK